MLRQFHFIDQNGKDQGINVRNRAKELAELLGDVDRIRAERKKARANRNKFGGVEGGAGLGGGFAGTGSRYGGFGSEDAGYGGYSGGVYGDGGGFGGNESGFSDTSARRDRFEEYDEYDEGAVAAPSRRNETASTASHVRREVKREPKKEEPPKPKEPVPDLLAFDEPAAPSSVSAGKQPAASNVDVFGGDDDDFDDFQSAAPAPAPVSAAPAKPAGFNIGAPNSTSTITSSTQFAAPQPQNATQNNNLSDLFATVSPPPAASALSSPPLATPASTTSIPLQQSQQPAGYQASGPNYFTSVNVAHNAPQSIGSTPSIKSPIGGNKPGSIGGKSPGGDAFAALLGGGVKKSTTPTQKVTMADMAKQKTSAGLWGAPAASSSASSTPAQQTGSASKPGGALGDLLG
jgi:epsin